MDTTANPLLIILITIITTASFTSGALRDHIPNGSGSCIPVERAALLSFKKGITGDPVGLLSSWRGQDCCRWRGITCSNETGHVLELRLRNPQPDRFEPDACWHDNSLFGEISSSLLSLEHLEHMDLSLNCLTVPSSRFPEFVGMMKNLRYLNLSGIPFTGRVPPQFGNLSKLQYLDLGWDAYSGMYSKDITWLTKLPLLRYLSMTQVDLSEITDWPIKLNMIPSLRVIRLSGCLLDSAHQSLQYMNLTKLEKLDLSHNYFNHSIASSWFCKATSLRYLNLRENYLFGQFHNALENMTLLQVLDLSYSRNMDLKLMVTGKFNNLCNLEIMDLTQNGMSGDIMEILPQCAWKKLQELHFSLNNFTGVLPNSIGQFTSLSILDLNTNNLSGCVPTEIGSLTKLTCLDLSNNNFRGVIREEHFVDLISLQKLDLSFNNLSVVLDADWFPPFKLEFALFASCHMGPLFPPWLQQQMQITKLDISGTAIVGSIPDWFWITFSKALYLDISNNQLGGTLPTHLDDMPFLVLNLSSNQLTGPIPPLPRNITMLDVSNNLFSGTLPSNIEAPQLATLVMFSNQIGGVIPESICKSNSMEDLDLSSNLLEGEIPQCFEIKSITFFLLSNNSLSGAFPAFLKNCTGLQFLDLAGNKLSGMLPSWIGELTNLQFLRLSHNTFTGNIPVEITYLLRLQYLDLSVNNLSGVIPPHVSNLTGMTLKGYNPSNPWGNSPIALANGIGDIDTASQFEDILQIITKGQQLKYGRGLVYFTSIDLSGNSLIGEIPTFITSLDALINLNLSLNHLTGEIPKKIGALLSLESLDLSNNKLSGQIPSSLSNLTSLSYLNFSYNNLSGMIPSGRQLDTLNADNPSSMYIGNSELCGPPIQKNCSGTDVSIHSNHRSKGQELDLMSFYLGLILGFVVGLWACFCALMFKKTWRIAYFQLFDKLYDKIYVLVAVKWASLLGRQL
ncbi:hypothetical protein ACP70R_003110 [Stipagrostis hirtigluma subsp. patula]